MTVLWLISSEANTLQMTRRKLLFDLETNKWTNGRFVGHNLNHDLADQSKTHLVQGLVFFYHHHLCPLREALSGIKMRP